MKDTREGEGVVRELATGSITSSRVMELTSNHASEMFQATEMKNQSQSCTAVDAVVNVVVRSVQSTVHDKVFVPFATPAVPVLFNSVTEIDTAVEGTLLVLQ